MMKTLTFSRRRAIRGWGTSVAFLLPATPPALAKHYGFDIESKYQTYQRILKKRITTRLREKTK